MTHAGIPPHWTIEDLNKYSLELHKALQGPEALNLLRNMYGNEPNHPSRCVTEMERLRLNINYLTRMRFCSKDGSLDLKNKGKATDAPSGQVKKKEFLLTIFELLTRWKQ